MSGEGFPTWQDKTDAIRESLLWAAGPRVCGDWAFKKEAFSLPDDNDPWFVLRMGPILEYGVDEQTNLDNIDPVTGEPDVDEPRSDMVVGQRLFTVQVRVMSRDQEHDTVAWIVAERIRSRMRFRYVKDKWFRPKCVALVSMGQVIPIPQPPAKPEAVELRCQSEAVLEVSLATVITETDAAAVGTWIEQVEVTSQIRNAGGTLIDSSLQLDQEVMP